MLADAGYGADGAFRAGVSSLGLSYAVGVQSTLSVWLPGQDPLPPKPWSGRGRPPSLIGRDAHHRPVSAKVLAASLAEDAWTVVTWREGTNAPLSSRFAAVRVRPASRDYNMRRPARTNSSSSSGRKARRSRPNTGSRPCLTTRR